MSLPFSGTGNRLRADQAYPYFRDQSESSSTSRVKKASETNTTLQGAAAKDTTKPQQKKVNTQPAQPARSKASTSGVLTEAGKKHMGWEKWALACRRSQEMCIVDLTG